MSLRESDANDARQEAPGNLAHWPWPRESITKDWARRVALLAALMVVLSACDLLFDYPKRIQEIPEPWQKLDPGKPPEKPLKIEVVKEGGAPIEAGDLVQVQVLVVGNLPGPPLDRGIWWLWGGFRDAKETAFYGSEPDLAAALLGVRQGTSVRFLAEGGAGRMVGSLRPNPFGNTQYYSWKKYTTDSTNIWTATAGPHSLVEIKRVCKAEATYRTVHLYDDSPVKVCPGLNCYTTREPREAWIDEARIDATCQDGKKVFFQFGPTGSYNGREGRSPVQGYFDDWIRDAWDKVPTGVQFVGNRPPSVVDYDIRVELGKSTEFNLVRSVRDPDGDPLSIVRLPQSSYGALEQLANGRYRYTAQIDCKWIERLHFKASDGMVESDREAVLEIQINPESKRCKDESDALGRAKRALAQH